MDILNKLHQRMHEQGPSLDGSRAGYFEGLLNFQRVQVFLDGDRRTNIALPLSTITTSRGSRKSTFLLTTRAGGLGSNLTTADVVVLYDSDRRAAKSLHFNILPFSKRERKSNDSVDNYFKDTLRAGTSKIDKAPKVPRAPKQISIQDFQFFDPRLAELQERETAVHKRMNGIPAVARDTPEILEEERMEEQKIIDEGL